MDQNLVQVLTGVLIVEVMEGLDLIKVFLQSNKPVLNVLVVVKKLPIHAQIVAVKEINKYQKKYQSPFQKELMTGRE